ncbi:MAG: aminotransferase class III-fold pyridoxal phosphate-dependent enzyme [Planctomycetes bacterium]|nr:aminotransferase class III-fold pyridoxal phosphate-dependent enzyme [Planctomycetota bacterium]
MNSSHIDPADVTRTGELMCQARRVLAYGGLDGVVQRPLEHDDGVFPQFAVRARGYEVWDSTGQSFVDWVNGWGPVLLGYRHPDVERAIVAQLEAGPTLSFMHPLEVEVATRLTEMIPCAEMVAFGKNGSDAVTAAVRIARSVTGRERILQHGFHGFHDWFVGVYPEVRGIPDAVRALVHPFPYDDLAAVESLFARHTGEVAAVVLEPTNLKLPSKGYLEGLRDLTRRHGALLVFDEMVTGFRLANGGAQELFGVVPDLACFGKSLANGLPLSAVVGKREYMQHLSRVGFGMTFRGETLSLGAARAVLEVLRRERVAEHLARVGTTLRDAFHRDSAARGVACELIGPPARMTFAFANAPGMPGKRILSLFLQECLKNGIVTNGNLLASFAHDGVALERTSTAFRKALDVVSRAIRDERCEDAPESGSPRGPRAWMSTGFIDAMRERDGRLELGGWMLLEDGAPDAIEITTASGEVERATPMSRPDLAATFPKLSHAERGGYTATLPASRFARDGAYTFTIVALRGSRPAFRCRVLRRRPATPSDRVEGPYWTGDGVLYV